MNYSINKDYRRKDHKHLSDVGGGTGSSLLPEGGGKVRYFSGDVWESTIPDGDGDRVTADKSHLNYSLPGEGEGATISSYPDVVGPWPEPGKRYSSTSRNDLEPIAGAGPMADDDNTPYGYNPFPDIRRG